jgi:poly-gamma-glutamate capsule biosynthesis protein CapA/YwtB (metallophosphatase superfamily)
VKISFIGDISLNGKYVDLWHKGNNPFQNLQPILGESDYVVGNLECIAKGSQGENLLKKPRLVTTEETLSFLLNINLKVACLAHNHVYDHLEDGFKKTVEFLNNNGIQHLGAGFSDNKAKKPLILSLRGITIGILNYVTHDTNPGIPDDAAIYLNYFDRVITKNEIQELKKSVDHVVILLHWGGRVEGGLYPDHNQSSIAHKLVDSGASLIIGHHSHTFQPYEIYKGKYIFYSLGNFCFSDFEFEGKRHIMPKRRMITGIVNVKFTKNSIDISTVFYKNKVTSFELYPAYRSKLKFRNFVFRKFLKYRLLWQIYFFGKQYFLPFSQFLTRRDIPVKQKVRRITKYFIKQFSY